VRAGLVSDLADYPSTSHAAYLDPNRAPPWLFVDPALKLFGSTELAARASYLQFMGQPIDDETLNLLRKGNQQGRILGDDEFARKILHKEDAPKLSEINLKTLTRMVAEKMDLSDNTILSGSRCRKSTEARTIIALLAVDHTQCSLNEVALFLNRDITNLCKQVRRLRNRREKSANINTTIEQLTAKI